MKKIVSITLLACLLFAAGVGAQDSQTAEFNASRYDSVSGFVSGTHARFPYSLPSYIIIHPAVYNILNVPLVEASYGGIYDVSSGVYGGHRFSAFGNLPLVSGQLSGGLEYQYLNTSQAATGNMGRLHAVWSNTVRQNFIIGAGLETGLSSGASGLDWALSAKVGISQALGQLRPFQDFTWNAAITNMGKEMTTPGGTYYRSPFTLAGGASATVEISDSLDLYNTANISLPMFTDVLVNLQSALVYKDNWTVSLGWTMDFAQQISSAYRNASIVPRIGFSYSLLNHVSPDIDTSLSVYQPYVGQLAFSLGAAIPLKKVDRDGPEITADIPEMVYLSPNNDGRQDNYDQPIGVSDRNPISSLTMRLLNGNETVFEQSWELEPVGEEGIYGLVREVFQTVQTVVIPDSILISGKDNGGTVLPDGEYTLELSAIDILGNETVITPTTIVLDTTKPEISIGEMSDDDKIFSPNGDGNKDVVVLPQTGSSEVSWTYQIEDAAGDIVWSGEISDESPDVLTWDGYDNAGQRLPDGVYQYEIRSRDLAGNENSAAVQNIFINSIVSPIRIELGSAYFSPNGDGIKDSIGLLPKPESRNGIRNWAIEILNDREETVTKLEGSGAVPEVVDFTGTNGSIVLSEGRYRARLILTYASGNEPRALSPWFTLDTTAPQARVQLGSRILSPNNDDRSDDISIVQETSEEDLWTADIVDASGASVQHYEFRGAADESIVWDGRTAEGVLAADGAYRYIISATDTAGNSTTVESQEFTLDTADAEVLISAGADAFSPNADGVKDFQDFQPRVNNNNEVARYVLNISSASGALVRAIQGQGPVPATFRWDGRNNDGILVDDGSYRAALEVELTNRSIGNAATRVFTVDTRAPALEASAQYAIFSPNGDGNRDSVEIRQSGRGEALYEANILNAAGDSVREYFWKDAVENFTWNGLDEFGNLAANGIYSYEISVTDAAGNTTSRTIDSIEVDSRNTNVFLTLSESGISPNGDGFKDNLQANLYTNLTEGITSWSFGIYDSNDRAVFTRTGTSIPSQTSIAFDGIGDDGELHQGQFYALFQVNYRKGDTPSARSPLFMVDTTGPVLSADLGPTPFGPDGDGVSDVLNIDLSSTDVSGVAAWRFSIYDRVGNLFQEFSSEGAPESRIFWDGLSFDGERVFSAEDYAYEFESIDNLGNSSLIEGLIPIDILVIKFGDQYKVQISNIVFEPNSPNIVLSLDTEVGRRNSAILQRLVEVFNKYPQYRIVIEGHANNVSGTEREQREELIPLSEGRAQAVKAQMVALGMDPSRIQIVGRGGSMPLVPFSDAENRWKNRRVEFILIR